MFFDGATPPPSHSSPSQLAKLGQILLRKRWITSQQLEEAISLQAYYHLRLGELLIRQGILGPPQLEEALQEQMWRKKGFWVI